VSEAGSDVRSALTLTEQQSTSQIVDAGNLAKRAWLASADFNRALVATEIANSIRSVSITTRRQYTVSISSRPQLHMPLFTKSLEFVLAAARTAPRTLENSDADGTSLPFLR